MEKKLFDAELLAKLKDLLTSRRETLAVAESVTAGYLQAALASAEEALQFFQGGITAYNLGQKAKHLNIDPIHAQEVNCVSDKVAEQMAQQVTTLFNCQWGIAITGYASPVPEEGIDELFAHIAISHFNTCVLCTKVNAPKGDSNSVRLFYTNYVLSVFVKELAV
jgi:PncC family amidohydrolase